VAPYTPKDNETYDKPICIDPAFGAAHAPAKKRASSGPEPKIASTELRRATLRFGRYIGAHT
jgi:hypothetical protein